jgi:hypothetical protein
LPISAEIWWNRLDPIFEIGPFPPNLTDFAEKSVDPIFEIGPFPPNLIDFAEKSAPD